jgi:hypothetical protein
MLRLDPRPYWRSSLASQGKPLQRSVGPTRAIGGQLGEVYVEALAEDVWVIAEADCRRVGCDGLEVAGHFTRRDREKMILRLVHRINDVGCQVQLVPQAA